MRKHLLGNSMIINHIKLKAQPKLPTKNRDSTGFLFVYIFWGHLTQDPKNRGQSKFSGANFEKKLLENIELPNMKPLRTVCVSENRYATYIGTTT